MKVVEGTTVDDAVNIMQEAHVNGLALVTQCSQVGHGNGARMQQGGGGGAGGS
jgi:ATP-dependent Clp protease adaptor protein ClpS